MAFTHKELVQLSNLNLNNGNNGNNNKNVEIYDGFFNTNLLKLFPIFQDDHSLTNSFRDSNNKWQILFRCTKDDISCIKITQFSAPYESY